jgi:hypothetical protein
MEGILCLVDRSRPCWGGTDVSGRSLVESDGRGRHSERGGKVTESPRRKEELGVSLRRGGPAAGRLPCGADRQMAPFRCCLVMGSGAEVMELYGTGWLGGWVHSWVVGWLGGRAVGSPGRPDVWGAGAAEIDCGTGERGIGQGRSRRARAYKWNAALHRQLRGGRLRQSHRCIAGKGGNGGEGERGRGKGERGKWAGELRGRRGRGWCREMMARRRRIPGGAATAQSLCSGVPVADRPQQSLVVVSALRGRRAEVAGSRGGEEECSGVGGSQELLRVLIGPQANDRAMPRNAGRVA